MLARPRSFLFFLPIVLLLVVLLLWARSYLPDHLVIRSNQGSILFFFVSGQYLEGFESPTGRWRSTQVAINYCRQVADSMSLPKLRLAGFEYVNLNFKSSYPGFIAIPYWAIASPLAAISA